MFIADRAPRLDSALRLSGVSAPVIPKAPGGRGILHLGLGSFHRAHQAVYTADAMAAAGGDWGIVGVASRSHAVVDELRQQDLLYSVAEISPERMSVSIPRAHVDAFVAAEEPERVVQEIADDQIRIVTLTVTENGYCTDPATGRLDTARADVAADLRGENPHTAIGQLARGLQRRAANSGAPLTVLSCDNLAENGKHLEDLVREFFSLLPDAESEEGLAFLKGAVTFPSSMVDRIVPATTPELRQRVAARLGAYDGAPVPAEPFTMWAIEDRFAGERPAWDARGAIFTTEVDRYEQMKVRLLNGTHSLIAYLGALRGARTIPKAIASDVVAGAAEAILRDEYGPSVQMPSDVDLATYKAQLFERWRNSALGHRTAQVGSDGSVKLRQRIPGPALQLLDSGSMPHQIALTVAGYLSCIAPLHGFDPGPEARAMTDGAKAGLQDVAARSRDGKALAEQAISHLRLFGDGLADRHEFITRVGELIDIIHRHGVDSAISDAAVAQPAS